MTVHTRHFIEILLINFVLVVIYALIHILARKKTKDHGAFWFKALVMLLCPILGPAFLAVGYTIYKLFSLKDLDLTDVIFSKERVATYSYADEDRERNFVPLEEAIAISDKGNLRDLMMNVIRGDIKDSLATIALALNSEDSETSHYAASVLQDALDQFRSNVTKNFASIQKREENCVPLSLLTLDYMNQVLKQHVFTNIEQQSFVAMMNQIGDILKEVSSEAVTCQICEVLVLRLLEVKDFDNCQKWCEFLELHYPYELATYTCQLKLYFMTGDRYKFFSVMDELKKSSIVIDKETLELIRVFS